MQDLANKVLKFSMKLSLNEPSNLIKIQIN
jgi:hypothetical protein